jgi:hypothetical protein
MKTSTIGIVSAAILMVAAGVGFGIAQAGETHTIGEYMEWQTPEQSSSSSSQEVPEWVNSPTADTEMQNPTETGSLPDESNSDSSTVEIEEGSYYRTEGMLYGP